MSAFVTEREGVATHADLRGLDVPPATITHRIGPRGPWQRGAPGVVVTHRGTLTRRERILVALAYAGPDAVVTGLDALAAAGGPAPALEAAVHVLVPVTRQRKSFGTIRVERTRRTPSALLLGGIPFTRPARAAVDACRHTERLNEARDVIGSTVQRRRCTVQEVEREVRAAARQRTALSRAVLAEVGDGIRSVAEARAREVLARRGVPAPQWNVRLLRPDGEVFLSPDGFWPAVAAALEIDSLAWHLGPDSYRRTKARERRLTLHGVLVLAFTPKEILDDPDGFATEVLRLLDLAARRPVPEGLTWLPADCAASRASPKRTV